MRAGGKRSIALSLHNHTRNMMSYQHQWIPFFTDLTRSRAIDEKCPAMSDLIHHVTTYVNYRNTIDLQETIPSSPGSRFALTPSHISSLEKEMMMTRCQWWKRCANGAGWRSGYGVHMPNGCQHGTLRNICGPWEILQCRNHEFVDGFKRCKADPGLGCTCLF